MVKLRRHRILHTSNGKEAWLACESNSTPQHVLAISCPPLAPASPELIAAVPRLPQSNFAG
jgi:hypothetical protein